MQKFSFNEAVEKVVAEDGRYAPDGYYFLKEALDFTVSQLRKVKDRSKHVSGPQLLNGIRLHALKEFGPMVPTVFEYWGISRCEDFGNMVFNLIGVGMFGKNESDRIEDFKGCYSFEEAFVLPFRPEFNPLHAIPGPACSARSLADAVPGDFPRADPSPVEPSSGEKP